jgi:integrase
MKPPYLMQANNIWRYNPPKDAVDEGVVKRASLGTDFAKACTYAEEQNKLMSEWRSERKYLKELTQKSRVDDLIKSYLTSNVFNKLGEKSRKDYKYYLQCWYKSKLGGVPLLQAKMGNVLTPLCQRVYDEHASNSISLANHSLAVYRVVFNYAIRQGFTQINPFAQVKPQKQRSRKVVWQREHVRAFLNTAFSRFEWRNAGLIVNMAYEWGQRLGDMRTLTWDAYNTETGVLTLTQSKRGANITLPTSDGLKAMLAQQHEDFGWQPYIAPASRHVRKKLVPYSLEGLSKLGALIMDEADLPEELTMMDLRRTAISEMVEVGVPISSIMAMSGHATPSSLTPYIKHTLRGASTAQTMREFPSNIMER